METVDLVCHDELMPRVKLLAKHMQTLGVELRLHTKPPKPCPPRLLVAPTAKHPIATHGIHTAELVAIYLEARTPAVAADYRIDIPAWPARSSDPDVARLAAHLIAKPDGYAKSEPADEDRRPRGRRISTERLRAGIALVGIITVSTALFTDLFSDIVPDLFTDFFTTEWMPESLQTPSTPDEKQIEPATPLPFNRLDILQPQQPSDTLGGDTSATSVLPADPIVLVEQFTAYHAPNSQPQAWLTQPCPIANEFVELTPTNTQTCALCGSLPGRSPDD